MYYWSAGWLGVWCAVDLDILVGEWVLGQGWNVLVSGVLTDWNDYNISLPCLHWQGSNFERKMHNCVFNQKSIQLIWIARTDNYYYPPPPLYFPVLILKDLRTLLCTSTGCNDCKRWLSMYFNFRHRIGHKHNCTFLFSKIIKMYLLI